MSRFLGPIHHWLFNKIRLHEELEQKFIENTNPEFKYEFNIDETNGQKTLVHVIYK